MSDEAGGTTGGRRVTSETSTTRRRTLALFGGAFAILIAQTLANIGSSLDDLRDAGILVETWQVVVWEVSSAVLWLALLPVLWWLVRHVRPPRHGLIATALLHAAATVPLSMAHIFGMIALRRLAYAAVGESYRFGGWPERLLYEYRKDVATYLLLAAFGAFAQWLLTPAPVSVPNAKSSLLVPDGSVTHHVPILEIDAVTAAGNYVELAWGSRTLLHRATLASVEAELGDQFVRVHRGRLVRRAAVLRVETERSGDFTVALANGGLVRGSRRYRERL